MYSVCILYINVYFMYIVHILCIVYSMYIFFSVYILYVLYIMYILYSVYIFTYAVNNNSKRREICFSYKNDKGL